MFREKGKRSLDNFSRARIIIENIEAMLALGMIYEGDGNISLFFDMLDRLCL
ncbi:hypothetical protein KSZ_30560 [Dictyobacter formicarum]|uniref:Uncharacterized protein n=1 Tax=Dictyobacter formicarum TaxID=2778368 RepID=A0ABQ3VGY9_9CHLR|nr:hypothetical protein KSZ_30560 [Dictyobacter formicarum]